jgi:alkanesulfonate monooxygenase SsuD/methylene tetrahydromethanopterin reductase-like flavin-dependent oxidoreductase (luciferase family)
LGVDELSDLARAAEASSYSTVLIAERVADAFSLCIPLLHATSAINVGTAVTNARLRHPVAAAMTGMALQAQFEGRFRVGFGVANSFLNEQKLGLDPVAPVRWMEEYVAVFRRTCSGEPVDFKGSYFHIDGLEIDGSACAVPVHLAALQPAMLRLASRVADGVILNLCPVARLPEAIAQLDRASSQREEGLGQLEISCVVPCCVSSERSSAEAAARQVVLDYAMHPSAARLFASETSPELIEAIQAKLRLGDRVQAVSLVPQELADRFVATGSPAECVERLLSYGEAGVGTPIVFPRPVHDDWAVTALEIARCYRRACEQATNPPRDRPTPAADSSGVSSSSESSTQPSVAMERSTDEL